MYLLCRISSYLIHKQLVLEADWDFCCFHWKFFSWEFDPWPCQLCSHHQHVHFQTLHRYLHLKEIIVFECLFPFEQSELWGSNFFFTKSAIFFWQCWGMKNDFSAQFDLILHLPKTKICIWQMDRFGPFEGLSSIQISLYLTNGKVWTN